MIANLWAKVPAEEQKLILGIALAVIAAGGLKITNNSVAFDAPVIIVTVVRYFTDAIQRIAPPTV